MSAALAISTDFDNAPFAANDNVPLWYNMLLGYNVPLRRNLGRVTRTDFAHSGTLDITRSYDAVGNVKTVSIFKAWRSKSIVLPQRCNASYD